MRYSWLENPTRTLVLVNLAGIMEMADEALLPGVYQEVGLALHISPTQLGFLTLLRSITQAACYPLAAFLAIHRNRAHVIALGAFLWAAATFLVGISTTFAQAAISRSLNGIGLAIVIPAIQSLVADSTDKGNRGWAFGWLQFTGNFGAILGTMISVLLASTTVMGISGWRISFHIVAGVSVVVGVLVRAFATDPRFSNGSMPRTSPIFAEIVPEKERTSIYALDCSFESILTSFAPPVVGFLAQRVYGYKPIPEDSSKAMEIETDRGNAAALAKALYTAIAIPMALCCLIYSFLYRAYPKDRDIARLETHGELEMWQQVSPDSIYSPGYYSTVETQEQIGDSEEKLLNDQEIQTNF